MRRALSRCDGPPGPGDGRDPRRRRRRTTWSDARPVVRAGRGRRRGRGAAPPLREARRPSSTPARACSTPRPCELLELAELLQAPVMTTLEGKSAFPEDHPLALGTGGAASWPAPCSTSCAGRTSSSASAAASRATPWPRGIPGTGKTSSTRPTSERDLNKSYPADHPLLGDAQARAAPVHRRRPPRAAGGGRASEVCAAERVRARVARKWGPERTSAEVPITPYRVIAEFMRDRIRPRRSSPTTRAARATRSCPSTARARPRTYIGWGKSHALGTGLGLIIGAKLAAPDKFCVNFMGDAAFGMTGLDFETAVRCGIPSYGGAQQLADGHRDPAPRRVAREVRHARHRRRLRGDVGRAMGGLERAGRAARGHRGRPSPAPGRPPRAVRRRCSSSSPARRRASRIAGRSRRRTALRHYKG